MIKNDFEKNNEDDWLAKEIKRESRISAWDLDGARQVRLEHEENCDARTAAEEHHRIHERRRTVSDVALKGKLSVWFYIDLFAVMALFGLSLMTPGTPVMPAIFLFLCLNPGIFVWLFLFKRYPSASYLKTVFSIAVFWFLYLFLIGNQRYISYLLWRLFE
ncbi:MAG: hypothetical protein IJK53_07200 [Erysipelotrichaceae bacterium]|nr:hypothetical protein [Erysipelotrichaceae bacterium]MBR3006683.1 hypothetical protein [Erysipelotrichaceae bacterium]MBR6233767.1 hypothetical protein [Erysipelotrichaceae bacterium]